MKAALLFFMIVALIAMAMAGVHHHHHQVRAQTFQDIKETGHAIIIQYSLTAISTTVLEAPDVLGQYFQTVELKDSFEF
ncbi:hypothetical protein NPIL_84491 [Nephila pilipes]|uniref:Uncharacterized protein n=1 Tax=Nephila pilipes TaxID=299642 RepID=A0A8X6P296_NEPPI|nr:hypothetical protein NPIL_84491 [Nephila pilipes]